MPNDARFDKLNQIMRRAELDILALIPGPNHRYLFDAEHFVLERPIVTFIVPGQEPVSVIPELEIPLFKRHAKQSRLYAYTDAQGHEGAFRDALDSLQSPGKTIGVEGQNMRFFEGEAIRAAAPDAEVIDASSALADLRIIKDATEIVLLRKAIQISEEALEATLAQARVGMSEIELAAVLQAEMKSRGADGLAFDIILHAGGNTALPHSGPLEYRMRDGDPLLFDFGATYHGYCADITRVVFIGAASAEQRAFYAVVEAANKAGREAARPGVTAESVDRAARQVIIDAGYEALMRHRTGHGLGTQAHEPPYIVEGNKRLLEPGMVITIEPGIYRLGEIGVRIEDDVLITETGAESLTTFPRVLRII